MNQSGYRETELQEKLGKLGYGRVDQALPESTHRFSDGARYRFEIPSCEGPQVLEAVLDEAGKHGVAVRRVSQGSGVMMLSDAELDEMVKVGAAEKIEISLFIGPRAGWETGGFAQANSLAAGAIRGNEGLRWGMAEALRAAEHGIRSLLVADLGLLTVLDGMRKAGDLPADMIFKVSVMTPVANAATARTLDSLGAGTLNLVSDMPVTHVSEVRAATTKPIDLYVESPDDMGGFVRLYEVPELIRVAAPIYVKLGLRNAPGIYPTGLQLGETPANMGRERVRRAAHCMRMIAELAPELVEGAGDENPEDLAIPVV
jgi:hypothetical protein